MNQILATSNEKRGKRKSGPIEIKSIVRFFAITLIIFGIILISQGSYALFKDKTNIQQPSVPEARKPEIIIERVNDTLIVNILHTNNLLKVTYKWNDDSEQVLDVQGKREVEEILQIPVGDNNLTIEVVDTLGVKATYQNQYVVESNNDTEKPKIELAIQGNKLIIKATDETQMSYITYKWDNEQETRVDVNIENPKSIETTLSVPSEERKLIIIAVDIANNSSTMEKQIKGIHPPKINVIQDGGYLIIEATDEEEMGIVEYSINGKAFVLNFTDETKKIVRYRHPLDVGENIVYIKAYNKYNATSTFEGRCEYIP